MTNYYALNYHGDRVYDFDRIWEKGLCVLIEEECLERKHNETLKIVAYVICLVVYSLLAVPTFAIGYNAFWALSIKMRLFALIAMPFGFACAAAPAVAICQNLMMSWRSLQLNASQRETAIERRTEMINQKIIEPDELAF